MKASITNGQQLV